MNKKVVIFLLLICFITFSVLSIRFSTSPNLFDENKHIDNVYKRAKLRYPDDDFTVYPIFNEDDKLSNFIIEFDCGKFKLVSLRKPHLLSILIPYFSGHRTMYVIGNLPNETWYRYKFNTKLDENNDLVYEEIPEDILRYKSPYVEAGYEDEKYYLLNKYIFAVKLSGEYFNLISMDYVKEDKRQPFLYIEYAYLFEYDL